ncbi:MAG TPA: hypothetical protein PKZ52_03780, partial [Cellvibrionaceae bacterium]|nr:hypothetical protein [Cellvibrionaceae bacterium]
MLTGQIKLTSQTVGQLKRLYSNLGYGLAFICHTYGGFMFYRYSKILSAVFKAVAAVGLLGLSLPG